MKRIVILGAVGKNPRKNRDGFRVFHRWGGCVTIQSHTHTEPPLFVRRYEEENDNDGDNK